MFPSPLEMQKNVSAHGRRMVTIVDPHIKRDDNFPVHKEATQKGYYIKVLHYLATAASGGLLRSSIIDFNLGCVFGYLVCCLSL